MVRPNFFPSKRIDGKTVDVVRITRQVSQLGVGSGAGAMTEVMTVYIDPLHI